MACSTSYRPYCPRRFEWVGTLNFSRGTKAEEKRLAAEKQRDKTKKLSKTKAPLDDEKVSMKINSGGKQMVFMTPMVTISANDFVSSRDYDGVEEGDVNDASAELTEEEAPSRRRNAEECRRERDGAALQLMWDAETFVTIPPELEHLTEVHWAYVETILTCLEIQRSMNRIH